MSSEDSDAVNLGSNPSPPASLNRCLRPLIYGAQIHHFRALLPRTSDALFTRCMHTEKDDPQSCCDFKSAWRTPSRAQSCPSAWTLTHRRPCVSFGGHVVSCSVCASFVVLQTLGSHWARAKERPRPEGSLSRLGESRLAALFPNCLLGMNQGAARSPATRAHEGAQSRVSIDSRDFGNASHRLSAALTKRLYYDLQRAPLTLTKGGNATALP